MEEREKAEFDGKLYELIKESIVALFDGCVPLEQAKQNATNLGLITHGRWKDMCSKNSNPVRVSSGLAYMLVYQGLEISELD
ncbi:MAG: hypothetical protein PUB52_02060 [Lachnospiraceae bacterium]|nr:hypothetical protein [Lachnospiraceae bacterium]